MNHNEHSSDTALIWELRDSLSELATPKRPPLAAITSRGRAHQRRRLAAFAGLGGASVAACAALALGLTGALGTAAPPASTGTTGIAAPARSIGTIQTEAFTLTSNANGTDTLTLTMRQVFDPAVFQRALAQHGIPALVKSGIYCTSSPAPPNPATIGVLSVQPPFKPKGATRVPSGAKPSSQLFADTKTVINPSLIPAGTELFFGYSSTGHALFFDLIYTHSYTCGSGRPPSIP